MPDREPHLAAFHDHALTRDAALDAPAAAPAVAPPAPLSPAPFPGAGPPFPAVPRPDDGDETLAERLARLRDDPKVVGAVVLVVALVAGLLFYRSAMEAGAGSAAGIGSPPATATTSTLPSELVVHVSGAVAHPGVYRLRPGARVADALDAAGGAVPGAQPDLLNLAALVGDGQRVHVPREGEVPPSGVPPPGGEAGAAAGTAGAPVTGPLDLNLATLAQLEALPGVGPSLARAIVSERERRGGFRRVDDLLAVRGIGEKRLADLRPLVTV